MKQALREFGDKLESGEGHVALFYFAGHGVQVNGRNYLIPIGADATNEAEAEDECVNVDLALAQMKRARQGLNIVILDACRNNPFRGWRSPEGGLAFVNAPRGTLIAYATSPGRTAADGRGRNSPYTAALLNHIRKPNISLLRLFEHVRAEVESATNGVQTPWESTSVTNGSEFYLAGKTDPPPPPPEEQSAWERAKARRTAEAVRAFLSLYPNSKFENEARELLAALEPAKPPEIATSPVRPSPSRTASFTTAKVVNGRVEKSQSQCDLFVEDLGAGVTIELARIPAGRFQMGSPANEACHYPNLFTSQNPTSGSWWIVQARPTKGPPLL